MQGNSSNEQVLTARQIFDKLLKGQIVRIGPEIEAANQLKAHLNVIKSRHKKLFKSLGLDFVASIISIEYCISHHVVKLSAPKQRKAYAVFAEKENEPASNPI